MDRAAADLAALLHGAFIVFLVIGGVACLRWPGLLKAHVVAVAGMATVNLLDLDCPFTVVQKHFIERAGDVPYEGGFNEHYLIDPIWDGGITPAIQAVIVACWLTPTVISYAVLLRRRRALLT
jgi:hypothetical protein